MLMGSESATTSNQIDLPSRQQAWVALSVLFVDTELSDATLKDVARRLNALHLDPALAEEILFEDVAPVFGKNMLSVAGNWTGWNEKDVIQLVSEWITKRDASGLNGALLRSAMLARLRKIFTMRFIGAEWQKVLESMAQGNWSGA